MVHGVQQPTPDWIVSFCEERQLRLERLRCDDESSLDALVTQVAAAVTPETIVVAHSLGAGVTRLALARAVAPAAVVLTSPVLGVAPEFRLLPRQWALRLAWATSPWLEPRVAAMLHAFFTVFTPAQRVLILRCMDAQRHTPPPDPKVPLHVTCSTHDPFVDSRDAHELVLRHGGATASFAHGFDHRMPDLTEVLASYVARRDFEEVLP